MDENKEKLLVKIKVSDLLMRMGVELLKIDDAQNKIIELLTELNDVCVRDIIDEKD